VGEGLSRRRVSPQRHRGTEEIKFFKHGGSLGKLLFHHRGTEATEATEEIIENSVRSVSSVLKRDVVV
jgi:hypothetical protein